jgi:L-seryl-tRNA(Ser) seleniumtransferase
MSPSLAGIPAIGTLLEHCRGRALVDRVGHELATWALRRVIDTIRRRAQKGHAIPSDETIIREAAARADAIVHARLHRVINATGVVLHTNLGRAVLGKTILQDITPVVTGYSDLEFNLITGRRGHRNDHVRTLLRYLCDAEDAIVVNNNAAALILALNTLAAGKDVLVSHGELIEIGGSFRIPEIIEAGGARMRAVGTTNKTRLQDYADAIDECTGCILKVHTSNYAIRGFTEEVDITSLTALAHHHGLACVYDIGSGMLRRPDRPDVSQEPEVREAVQSGADVVCFSGDKLLGGPQAGIIAGPHRIVARLETAPLMRALRVGKLTYAALMSACRHYCSSQALETHNVAFSMLNQTTRQIKRKARRLQRSLSRQGIRADIVTHHAYAGGGSLPDRTIESLAVAFDLDEPGDTAHRRATAVYHALLRRDTPIVAVLREGRLLCDVYTVFSADIAQMARDIATAVHEVTTDTGRAGSHASASSAASSSASSSDTPASS